MTEERVVMETEAKSQSEALDLAQRSMENVERDAEKKRERFENTIAELQARIREEETNLRRSQDQVPEMGQLFKDYTLLRKLKNFKLSRLAYLSYE